MKKLFALLLAAMLICTAALSTAEEAVAVRVGKRTFTRQQVQKYINQVTLNIELASGQKLTDLYAADERQQFLMDAAEHFVTVGILREKLKEAGQDQLTEYEQSELNEYARTMYDEVWNSFFDRLTEAYPDLEFEASFVTEVMEEAGYSMDDIYEIGLLSIQEQRLFDLFCADITITDEELLAYYDEHFVAPDREKYQNNIAQFELDIVLQGGSSGYTPEGFYFVKFLAFDPSPEYEPAITAAQEALTGCMQKQQEINGAVVSAVLDGTDVEQLRAQLLEAQTAVDAAQAELDAAKAAAAADYEPMMVIVRQAMSDGVSFDELIDMYGNANSSRQYSDDGFPFHPQSAVMDEDFVQEVTQLAKKGDVTGPFYAGSRVYIVYRDNDVKSGAYEPDQETMESLRAALLYDRQQTRLNELTAQWRNDVDVVIDITGLEFPEY